MREGGSKIGELRGSPNLAKLQQSPPPPKWRVKDPAKVEGEARTRGTTRAAIQVSRHTNSPRTPRATGKVHHPPGNREHFFSSVGRLPTSTAPRPCAAPTTSLTRLRMHHSETWARTASVRDQSSAYTTNQAKHETGHISHHASDPSRIGTATRR